MTAQITIECDMDAEKLSEDIRNITALNMEITEIFNDFTAGLKLKPRKINDHVRTASNRFAVILERSVNSTYFTDICKLNGCLLDRILVCAQAMLKNFALSVTTKKGNNYNSLMIRNQEEIRSLFSTFQNNMKQLEETAAEQAGKAMT